MKALLRGNFIALNAYIKTGAVSQANKLTLHLKELEKSKLNLKLEKKREREREIK